MKHSTDVQILIADDHKMVRNGLRLMLTMQSGEYNFLITEADNGNDAIKKVVKKDFDIILLDYQMPGFNGDVVISRVLMHKPKSKIIILSNYDEKGFIQSCVRNGAKGYILKDIDTEGLLEAIETVLDRGTYFSGIVEEKLYDEEDTESQKYYTAEKMGLSARELEILQLIAKENTNEEISKILKLSKRTIDSHRLNLLHKLKVKNTVGLVKLAISNQLL